MANIIILTNEFYPFKGGIGRYSEEVIKVIKKNHQVTLVAPEYDGSLKDTTMSDNITLNLFSGGQFKYWHLPKLIKKLLTIDFKKYDSILVADWPFWVAIEFINKFFPWRKIYFNLMIHGSDVLNLRNGKAAVFGHILNLFDGINTIFSNSEYTKRMLFEHHDVPAKVNVQVTYLGVEQDPFINNIKYIQNVRNEIFNILSVGRLDERKGYDYVIKSIGILDENIKSKINYTVVGNGTDTFKNTLTDLAKYNKVNLSILSGVDDYALERLYEKSNLFVLSARHSNKKIEGFGLVFLEAAKYGLPSIATDVGAISEVVKNGVTGLVVSEDILALSNAILECYSNRDILINFSNNCIDDVKKYTWEQLVEITFSELN